MGEAWALMEKVLDCAVLVANDAMASGAAICMTEAALFIKEVKEAGSKRVLQDTGSAVKGRESDWLGHGSIATCYLLLATCYLLLATFAEQETNSFRCSINRLIYIVV